MSQHEMTKSGDLMATVNDAVVQGKFIEGPRVVATCKLLLTLTSRMQRNADIATSYQCTLDLTAKHGLIDLFGLAEHDQASAALMRKVPQDLLAPTMAQFYRNGAIFAIRIGAVYKPAP